MIKSWFPIKSRNCNWSDIYTPYYANPIVKPLVMIIFLTIELVQWFVLCVRIVLDSMKAINREFRVLDGCVSIMLIVGITAFVAGGKMRLWIHTLVN